MDRNYKFNIFFQEYKMKLLVTTKWRQFHKIKSSSRFNTSRHFPPQSRQPWQLKYVLFSYDFNIQWQFYLHVCDRLNIYSSTKWTWNIQALKTDIIQVNTLKKFRTFIFILLVLLFMP